MILSPLPQPNERVIRGGGEPDQHYALYWASVDAFLRALNATVAPMGQYVESDVESGSAVGVSNNVSINVTSISIGAGDWDISGVVYFAPAGGAAVSYIVGSISLVTNTADITNGRFGGNSWAADVFVNTAAAPIVPKRFVFSTTTSVFLVATSGFSGGSMAAYGHLRARRIL